MSSDSVRQSIAGKQAGPSGYIRSACPFCAERVGSADRHHSLSVSEKTGWWNCWRCAARGKLRGEFELTSDEDRAEETARRLGAAMLPDGYIALASPTARNSSACTPALDYLHGRGVSDEIIADAELGVILQGPLAHRIVIPIWDKTGRLHGWQARAYVEGLEPKARSAPGMLRGEIVYNPGAMPSPLLPYSPDAGPIVYLVEGPADAWALWPNACAFLGKPTSMQIALIRDYWALRHFRIAVAFDGDAWLDAVGVASEFALMNISAVALRFPPGEDPSSLGGQYVRAVAAQVLGIEEGRSNHEAE